MECRSATGNPLEDATYDVQRHLETWLQLGRLEPVEGGVFVIAHNLRTPPLERPAEPFRRDEFVHALRVAVIDASALYLWWANTVHVVMGVFQRRDPLRLWCRIAPFKPVVEGRALDAPYPSSLEKPCHGQLHRIIQILPPIAPQ